MSTYRRKNIALFMAMLENEFSIEILEGAYKAALEADVNLTVFPMGLIDGAYSDKVTNNYRYQYNTLSSFMQSSSIDAAVIEYGTIVSSVDEQKKKEFLSLIGDIPTVLLNEHADGYPSISVNNKVGLMEVIYHIIDKHKKKKIGYISGPKNNHDAQERLLTFKEAIENRGLTYDEDWVAYGNFSIYSEEATKELIEKHPDIEALVFANDHMALGAYKILEKYGYEIGKDIIVTGFDNIPSSILSVPTLTTVAADISQLSYRAVMGLAGFKQYAGNGSINTHMILRESCGCSIRKPLINGMISEYIAAKHSANELDQRSVSVDDVRNATKEKVREAEKRKEFEVELGNITREMVYYQNTDTEWFSSVLDILKKLEYQSGYIYLFDSPIYNKNHAPWIAPATVDLRGYYNATDTKIYEKDEYKVNLSEVFNYDFIEKSHRSDLITIPLFFRETHYGLLMIESDIKYFQFAFQMASHISSTLEIINILNAQEKIKQELDYANKSKSSFLANMSHEIRTPINAILGMNEMILRENTVPEIDKYAMDIKNAAKSLLSIVNDILDFSKIEAGKMTLVPSEYKLEDLLHDTREFMRPRFTDKKLTIEIECDENLPSILYGDDVRIKQILLNLLSNAAKYTNEGGAVLTVSRAVASDSNDNENIVINFSVKDTGIGIKQEDLSKLFEKFERIEEKRNRTIEGTGLGMSITLGFLNLMGSTLKVDSVYNEGSTFSFSLIQKVVDNTPIGNIAFKENKVPEKVKFKQKFKAPKARILVVDDIDINRVIVASLLSQSEIQVDEAESGKKCLELCKENFYDIILLDHMMPELDGIETLAELNKMEGFDKSKTTAIALTANAIEGSEQLYLSKGFDAYISKPVDPDILDNMLIQYISEDKIELQ